MLDIIIKNGAEARRKILKGAARVGELVGASLGPKGRTAILKVKYSPPQIFHDGVSIARNIMLKDDIEDLGAQTLIEGAMKADARAGDGTTTCTILASKIAETYAQRIESEDRMKPNESGVIEENTTGQADVNSMAKEILDTGKAVVEKLKEMAKPLGKKQLSDVITSSLGTMFPEFTNSLAETIETVGKDGYVSVEDNWHTKYGIETDLIKGMRFLGTYATPYSVNTKRKEAIFEGDAIPIIVCNHDLASLAVFYRGNPPDPKNSILSDLIQKGHRKIIILANKFETPLVKLIAATTTQARAGNTNLVDFLCIKAPSLTTEQWLDVAAYCGGDFFDKNRSDVKLSDAQIPHLGFAKKVVVNEDEVIIIGGKGNPENRIKRLQEELEIEKDTAFKEQIKRRIGALQSGFAVIRVGAATEGERIIAKKKIEDAVNAAKCAMEEGILPGGGLALKKIAEELGEKHPMYIPLMEPYNRIQASLGGAAIPKTVIDPLKVTRIAVETACSVAASLITCEVAIAEKRPDLVDQLSAKLFPQNDVADDFRNDENQERPYRT